MRRPVKLTEGMREGDLADLVLPLISVDEFDSKVDQEDACIVFGFYVHDEEAADDLNRFLQRSAIPLMDTDVSPAPDQHGYYMVFVELVNNDRLAENLIGLLAEIKTLVDIEDWQMRVRKIDHLVAFSEDNLRDAMKRLKQADKHADVLEYLRPSALSNVLFENDLMILEGAGDRQVLQVVKLDRMTTLMEQIDGALNLNIRAVARTNRIRRMLGENWDVVRVGKYTLLRHVTDPRGLLTTD